MAVEFSISVGAVMEIRCSQCWLQRVIRIFAATFFVALSRSIGFASVFGELEAMIAHVIAHPELSLLSVDNSCCLPTAIFALAPQTSLTRQRRAITIFNGSRFNT